MEPSITASSESIDKLLAQLRVAGPKPPQELLDAIRALGPEAVPSLIAMVSDPDEYDVAESDTEDRTGWAPYAAIEILGDLHPPEALQPLLALLPWDDYDYLAAPLVEALGKFGRDVLDPLSAVMTSRHRSVWTRWRAVDALGKLAGFHPDLRDEVITRLVAQLDRDERDYEALEVLRGALVSTLVELRATEATPSVVRVYEEGPIDESIVSWTEVRRALSVPPDVAPHLDKREHRTLLDSLLAPSLAEIEEWEAAKRSLSDREAPDSYRRQTPKVGRNDPCPCGSGKKYKRCHGR